MLFTFYTSAKIHYAFHQFCFEYSSICSRLAVQHVCRIRFHVTLFYDVSFSLVKSHSLSDWISRMLVELFFSRMFHQRKGCQKKLRLFVANQTFFLKESPISEVHFFSRFVKSLIVGFQRNNCKRGSIRELNLVQGFKTQTWMKIVIQNETQTWTFDFWFGCRLKRKIFVVSILIKILRTKKREVLHVFDFSKIQTQT